MVGFCHGGNVLGNHDDTPAHLIENEPVAQATVPHIVLDMLSMLVVRQILQK